MYSMGSRRRSSPRRVLILLILIGLGVWIIVNQNQLRQQLDPPPTPTATRTARSYVVEAESLLEARRFPDAIDAFIQAISLEPENAEVLLRLSRLLALRGRTTEAVTYAERAAQLRPQDAPAQAALAMVLDWHGSRLQSRGRELEARQAYDRALTAARQAIALDRAYPEAYAYLAETYADLNIWENAIENAQQAVDLNPNRADVQRALGYVRESQGNYSGAVEAYRRAAELEPREAHLQISLGQNYRVLATLRDASQWQNALAAFQRAIDIDPALAAGYDELGWTHYLMEDFRTAENILEQAVQIDPQAWSPRSHLAATYYARRNYEEAAITFKQAIALMNEEFDADQYCVIAQTRACDRAVTAYVTMAISNCYLADAYNDPVRYYEGEAVPAFQRALTIRPDDEQILSGMDLCQIVMGKPPLRTPTPQPIN